MSTSRRLAFGGLLMAMALSAGGAACADSACALSCGSGLEIRWDPADLPDAPLHRLCVNGGCELVEPIEWPADSGELQVHPARAPGLEVEVRLELLASDMSPIETYRGSGTRTGECCPHIEFRATPDGELVTESG